MKANLRHKALETLATTQGQAAADALAREADRIAAGLFSSESFGELEEYLSLLDVFAFRVASRACEMLKTFLARLPNIELKYQEVPGFSLERLKKVQNSDGLVAKALKVFEHIRYFEPKAVLQVLLEYSLSPVELIANQAKHALDELAKFDLDVVYGDEKWRGLGFSPQLQVLEYLEGLDEAHKKRYFAGIVDLCDRMLSPTMQSTSSDYKTVTWKSADIPSGGTIRDVRARSLALLIRLYGLAEEVDQKRRIVAAMHDATRGPQKRVSEQTMAMIDESAIAVLTFWAGLIPSENLEVVQAIENSAYWIYYHARTQEVRSQALDVKALVDANEEYQVFKVLIGYEGVFAPWKGHDEEGGPRTSSDFADEDAARNQRVLELATSVTDGSYESWKTRIVLYAAIRSQDLATFRYFGTFLVELAKAKPDIALQLLREHSDDLERFFTPICLGLWETPKKEETEQLLAGWVNSDRYLAAIARIFEFNGDPKNPLLMTVFQRAVQREDRDAMLRVVSAVVANFDSADTSLVGDLFLPAIRTLTLSSDARWVFDCWFRKELPTLLAGLASNERADILANLLSLERIDHHAEEVLYPIAQAAPDTVLDFFLERLSISDRMDDDSAFEAFPYEFYRLKTALSANPQEVIGVIARRYRDNYGMFSLQEGRLLKNIFPEFPVEFERPLRALVRTKEQRNIEVVMAVLRNYDGVPAIQNVCKEIVEFVPADSENLNEVEIILASTGVVHGTFGFAEAYETKLAEIAPWKNDTNERVRAFANRYSERLRRRAEEERKRAAEELELRKRQFGDRGNETA